MQEFWIRLNSMEDVEEFVAIATSRAFPICVRDNQHKIRGGSFMEMFCLGLAGPLTVSVDCGENELARFKGEVRQFLAD